MCCGLEWTACHVPESVCSVGCCKAIAAYKVNTSKSILGSPSKAVCEAVLDHLDAEMNETTADNRRT